MNDILTSTSIILKELLVPLFTLVMGLGAVWVAYRRKLFSPPEQNIETARPHAAIQGEGNVVHISPSELQKKLGYDPTQFDEYHQQSINQSRTSFWFSLFFASIGFLIIATSVFTYSDKAGYLGVVAGTIIDVVSALFFYQSNKARQLMSEFFDRLRSDRKLEESLRLCDAIDDRAMRDALKVRLSLFFSGLENSDAIASEIIRLAVAADVNKMHSVPPTNVATAQVNSNAA